MVKVAAKVADKEEAKLMVKEEAKVEPKIAALQFPPARFRPLALRQRRLPVMARQLRYGKLAISQARVSMARSRVLPEASAYAKISVCLTL